MELKQKGTKADIGAFKQMKVSLVWTSAVDLDLMAFYKTKDGRKGGIFSANYSGGSLGNLNQFPFIELSGDEGVGAGSGDKREEMRITKLDDFEELYICALNFTDASSGANKVFANYDARVEVVTDRGDKFNVSLDAKNPGSVAVICKFASGFIGTSLTNNSEVMNLDEFKTKVPGADQFKISSKVTLKTKNDSFILKPKAGAGEILINLNWNQSPQKAGGFFSKILGGGGSKGIDLDLGCLFETKDGMKGAVQPLGKAFGSFDRPPYVNHLGDDRTGASSAGENMKINLARVSELKRVLIYTYIYEGVPNWSATDGVVTVKVPGQPTIEVPMGTQADQRALCAIAMLDFDGGHIKVTNLVTFHNDQRDCDAAYRWGMKWVAGSKD